MKNLLFPIEFLPRVHELRYAKAFDLERATNSSFGQRLLNRFSALSMFIAMIVTLILQSSIFIFSKEGQPFLSHPFIVFFYILLSSLLLGLVFAFCTPQTSSFIDRIAKNLGYQKGSDQLIALDKELAEATIRLNNMKGLKVETFEDLYRLISYEGRFVPKTLELVEA